MRNKKMQARYDTWMIGMKEKYGSTGKSSISTTPTLLDSLARRGGTKTDKQRHTSPKPDYPGPQITNPNQLSTPHPNKYPLHPS